MNNTGIVAGNPVNNATDKNIRNRSRFNLSYHQFQTARFGELNSHFVQECVPGDKISLRSVHDLRTYSLKAPLMQNIELKKDYFNIPMEAILPLNWEKIYTNPVMGSDIDATTLGTSYKDFYPDVLSLVSRFASISSNTANSATNRLRAFLLFLVIGDTFFSSGSLMWQLGYHVSAFHPQVGGPDVPWDDLADTLYSHLNSFLTGTHYKIDVKLGNNNVEVWSGDPDPVENAIYSRINFRTFLDYIHLNSDWRIVGLGAPDGSDIVSFLAANDLSADYNLDGSHIPTEPINLARVYAYQLVCAHYYSNDAIDYVYSANLLREYLYGLLDVCFTPTLGISPQELLFFTYNGIRCLPDYLSSCVLKLCTSTFISFTDSIISLPTSDPYLQFILSAFGFKNSLRFLDYFSGSKSRPLAVGNVDVDTSGASVSVVEISRNIQVQKFLNSVNRSGRKFSNYIKELFGQSIAPDYHNPFYLAHTTDNAVAVEVENTGTDQLSRSQSVTAIVKANSSNYAFTFEADRPCILLGLFYFDIARSYERQMDKQLFHVDRYDMFNPYLQFIGDQSVLAHEMDSANIYSGNFGYQLRYAEYKQRTNRMIGGFVRSLPGFAFSGNSAKFSAIAHGYISPYFIRSHPFELDDLYISLTGFTPSAYFHFILDFFNEVDASRPMAFAPSIL